MKPASQLVHGDLADYSKRLQDCLILLNDPHLLSQLESYPHAKTRKAYLGFHEGIVATALECQSDIAALDNYLRLAGSTSFRGRISFASVKRKVKHLPRTSTPYSERVDWCKDLAAELVDQVNAHEDGREALANVFRAQVRHLHQEYHKLHELVEFVRFEKYSNDVIRAQCPMLVNDMSSLESRHSILKLEAAKVLSKIGGAGQPRSADSEEECSAVLERLMLYSSRRKLIVELAALDDLKNQIEQDLDILLGTIGGMTGEVSGDAPLVVVV